MPAHVWNGDLPAAGRVPALLQQLRALYGSTGLGRGDDPCGAEEEEEEDDGGATASGEEENEAAAAAATAIAAFQSAPAPMPQQFERPPPLALLRPGLLLVGRQRLPGRGGDWRVALLLHAVDLGAGTFTGEMAASGLPCGGSATIRTFLTGEVVDNVSRGFFTERWGASHSIDCVHWRRLDAPIGSRAALERSGGRAAGLASCGSVFLRLKEHFYLPPTPPDCGLTIGGFYYAALNRATGDVSGFYFERSGGDNPPFQVLTLHPLDAPGGRSTAAFQMR